MSKRQRKPARFNLTPLRLEMLRDAETRGSALAGVGERRATGMTRAFWIMVEAGVIDEAGRITPKGAEVLRGFEPGFDDAA